MFIHSCRLFLVYFFFFFHLFFPLLLCTHYSSSSPPELKCLIGKRWASWCHLTRSLVVMSVDFEPAAYLWRVNSWTVVGVVTLQQRLLLLSVYLARLWSTTCWLMSSPDEKQTSYNSFFFWKWKLIWPPCVVSLNVCDNLDNYNKSKMEFVDPRAWLPFWNCYIFIIHVFFWKEVCPDPLPVCKVLRHKNVFTCMIKTSMNC